MVPLSWAALEKLPINPRPSARAAGQMECCCNNSMPAPTSSVCLRPRVWQRLSNLAGDFVADLAMQGCRFIGAEGHWGGLGTQALREAGPGLGLEHGLKGFTMPLRGLKQVSRRAKDQIRVCWRPSVHFAPACSDLQRDSGKRCAFSIPMTVCLCAGCIDFPINLQGDCLANLHSSHRPPRKVMGWGWIRIVPWRLISRDLSTVSSTSCRATRAEASSWRKPDR
jgi:hypothetical protein